MSGAGWFSSFFGDGSWLAPVLTLGAITAVPTLYSAKVASDANVEAARIAAQGAQAQAQAIAEGNRLAQERYDQIQEQTAPATSYLTQIVASNPSRLTQQQQQGMDDLRTTTQRNLAASGLRGSGRAQLAALRSVESDYRNQAETSNRSRVDAAASALAGQYFNAAGQSANLDATTGRAVGGAMQESGYLSGNALTSNARVQTSALGDIASVMASEFKERGRQSAYGNQPVAVGETASSTEDDRKRTMGG